MKGSLLRNPVEAMAWSLENSEGGYSSIKKSENVNKLRNESTNSDLEMGLENPWSGLSGRELAMMYEREAAKNIGNTSPPLC